MKLLSTLLVLAALAVAGCGDDDEPTPTTTTTTGATGASGATGEDGAATGDFEQALKDKINESETVLNPDFTCEEEIPPPDGETVTCPATGETSDGAKGEGEIKLTTDGDTVSYEIEIKAGAQTSTAISSIGTDGGEASGGGSLLEP